MAHQGELGIQENIESILKVYFISSQISVVGKFQNEF